MTVAVVSDIHDNIWNLEKALRLIEDAGAEHLLFLGDLCAPFTMKQLAEGFAGPVDAVFGNNDGDQFLISRVAAAHPNATLHGQYAEVRIAGRTIALNHYPEIARRIAADDALDAVFYGHDHTRHIVRIGNTLLANPGEVMGRFGRPGFGLYDTERSEFRHVDLGGEG